MKRIFLITLILLPLFVTELFAQTGQMAPILTIETGGHKALIRETMFTSDGKYLVTTGNDKTVRVWNVETGETERVIRGYVGEGSDGKIFAADLSGDDRLLAVGGYFDDNEIRLVDFRTGEVTGLLKGHTNVIKAIALSSCGNYLISGSADKTARIWDIKARQTRAVLKGHTGTVHAVAFSPDGKRVATGSKDDTVKLWNAVTGRLVRTLTGHTEDIVATAFTPDSRYLLSGSDDKTIRLWNGTNGTFIKTLATQNRTVDSLSISPDGQMVLTGAGYGSGKRKNNIFTIPSGEKIQFFAKHSGIVLSSDFSPDGTVAATAGGDNNEIYLWNPATGKINKKMVGKGKKVWSVGFSSDGRKIAWGNTFDQDGISMYQLNGPLEQSFVLTDESGAFNPGMGPATTGQSGWMQAIESAGKFSIKTKNGKIHKTLQILKYGAVAHEITRSSSSGFDHRSFTLTPDGLTVISGGSNGTITSYDSETGKQKHKFIGHTGDAWGVCASPDSRFLVSGSSDQTVKLWHIDSGKLLLTIFAGSDNEWVAWTPAGYYTSSLKGANYIGWHINRGADRSALYYPGSRFASKFYSPETVAAYIQAGGNIDRALEIVNAAKPARKKIKKTKVSDLGNILPPVVYFKVPADPQTVVSTGEVRIKAAAKSVNREPVTDIWILVNGRRVDQTRGITLKNKKVQKEGLTAEIDITVPLPQGENMISVIAKNRYTQSEPEVIHVTWNRSKSASQPEDIFKPNLYILAIGVSEYQDRRFNLDVAANDAKGIVSVFKKQEGKLYNRVKAKLLTNAAATKDNILDGLDWLMQESTQKDLAVVFIAGHGVKDNLNNYYFLSHDSNPEKLRRSAVKWLDFDDVVTNLPSKVMLLADTCHSGSITGKRRGISDITDALRDLVNTDSGVVVMTASTGGELSRETKDWGHGAFTKALIEGLDGEANYNKDRRVDLKELDLYVTERVKSLTNGTQHPTTEIPSTLPNFPVTFQ